MKDEKTAGGRRWVRWALILIGAVLICGFISVLFSAFGNDSDPAAEVAQQATAALDETDGAGRSVAIDTSNASIEDRPTDQPVATVLPTATVGPTDTPEPTNTPRPTETPRPTDTPQPPPEPVILSGNGDDLVDFEGFPDENLIGVHITGSGSSNFAVWNYDANGDQIDLLVNEIGSYDGQHLLNVNDVEPPTAGFEVTASGPWTIEVYPFDPAYVTLHETPGEVNGSGDDFFVVVNDAGINRATISHDGSSNFAVWLLAESGMDLLVNEIGAYVGTVRTGASSVMIFMITADGDWSVDMNAE